MAVSDPVMHANQGGSQEQATSPIVFYDGVCGLCNRSVHFVIGRDRRARFQFAPLQGTTLQSLGLSEYRDKLDTMLLYENGRAFARSDAVLRILSKLRWPWSWLGVMGFCVPRFLREATYRWVARRRYRWFGQLEFCPVPEARHASRFLP